MFLETAEMFILCEAQTKTDKVHSYDLWGSVEVGEDPVMGHSSTSWVLACGHAHGPETFTGCDRRQEWKMEVEILRFLFLYKRRISFTIYENGVNNQFKPLSRFSQHAYSSWWFHKQCKLESSSSPAAILVGYYQRVKGDQCKKALRSLN